MGGRGRGGEELSARGRDSGLDLRRRSEVPPARPCPRFPGRLDRFGEVDPATLRRRRSGRETLPPQSAGSSPPKRAGKSGADRVAEFVEAKRPLRPQPGLRASPRGARVRGPRPVHDAPPVSLARLHFTPGSNEVVYAPKARHDGSKPAEAERIDAMEFVPDPSPASPLRAASGQPRLRPAPRRGQAARKRPTCRHVVRSPSPRGFKPSPQPPARRRLARPAPPRSPPERPPRPPHRPAAGHVAGPKTRFLSPPLRRRLQALSEASGGASGDRARRPAARFGGSSGAVGQAQGVARTPAGVLTK